MIRANVMEDDEQTMARFLNGLNHPIKKLANFQPYLNLIELVHQATKEEHQVQDDFKYAKFSSKSYGFSNTQASTTPTPLPQPSHLQGTATSQVTRKLQQPQFVLLLQATSSRELHHHLPQPMRPSIQVPSNASHAAAEATSLLSVQKSTP